MQQNYISEILFHFIGKDLQNEEEQYDLLKKIIIEGWISFPPHQQQSLPGSVSIDSMSTRKLEEMINPECICFADIPKTDIDLHVKKYSKFGLGFDRIFLAENGANPVFYVEANSTVLIKSSNGTYEKVNLKEYYQMHFSKTIFYFIMKILPIMKKNSIETKSDTELQDLWDVFNFLINVFSHFKPWNDSLDASDPSNFYYEREWRALNNIKFSISDVKLICLPNGFIDRFKTDFPQYHGEFKEIEC
jgi:hypothetical protein